MRKNQVFVLEAVSGIKMDEERDDHIRERCLNLRVICSCYRRMSTLERYWDC